MLRTTMRFQKPLKSGFPSVVRGGVKAFIVTPKAIPPSNRDRVLLHLHGGVRVFNPAEAGTREGILMAGFAHYKVITVDYRTMPGDEPAGAGRPLDRLALDRLRLRPARDELDRRIRQSRRQPR